MKRLKKLIEDHKKCWKCRKNYYIKWTIEVSDIDACSIFFLPTVCYNTYPYRRPEWWVFNVYFLHWYIQIGEWCRKED